MPWFKVDDAFHSHPKVMGLSPAAVGIWTLAGAWSANYLTDGEVQANIIRRFGGTSEMVQELCDSGLWSDNGDDTYQFKDWDDYQPVKADVEAEREAARERMRQVRAKKKGVEPTEDVQPNTSRTSEEVRVTPAQPVPSRPSVGGTRRKPEAPLPDKWAPNSAHKDYAAGNGISIDFQAQRFRNHAQANDRRARDWDAAFRNWLLKAEKSPTASKNPLWDD